MSEVCSINKTTFNGVAALQIRRRECTALVSLLGGQVMSFQPVGERPVLWHNPDLDWSPDHALRQGIPICWPWFGELQRNPAAVQTSMELLFAQSSEIVQKAAHGTVRTSNWILENSHEHDGYTEITLGLEAPPAGTALSARYRFGKSLACELITHNTGRTALTMSMALHSYFAVSDIESLAIAGLDGCTYIDALADWSRHQQTGQLRISAETDRIYLDVPPELNLIDAGWRRQITLLAPESQSAVVWNPWVDKSQRLSQFGSESFRGMVCIETARVMDDVFTIAPGQQSTLSLNIASRSSDNS